MRTLLEYCDICEQDFIEEHFYRQRHYNSDICAECAEREWELWNERMSEM